MAKMTFHRKWDFDRGNKVIELNDLRDDAEVRALVTDLAGQVGTFASVSAPSLLGGGRKWGMAGDSITNGSTAAAGRRFVDVLPHMVGTAHIAPISPNTPATGAIYSVVSGGPGERSDQILSRVDSLIAAGVKGITLLAGTNDASQAVSTATYMSNIAAAALKCRKASIPLVVGTVPPRASSASAAIRTAVAAYNLALRSWAAGAGVYLADVYGALVDPATGYLAAAYDSGDGTHPNTAGHRRIAEAFTTAVQRTILTETPLISGKSAASLVPNPTLAADGSGWFEQPGGSGTAPTYNRVADTTGRLPEGAYWYEQDFDGTASGGTRTFAAALSGTYAVGDLLLVCGQMDLIDVSGNYAAAANADPATAQVKYGVTYGGSFLPSSAYAGPMSRAPGEIATPVTATSASSLVLWCTVTIPTGVHLKTRLSCADVRNLTALGVTGY